MCVMKRAFTGGETMIGNDECRAADTNSGDNFAEYEIVLPGLLVSLLAQETSQLRPMSHSVKQGMNKYLAFARRKCSGTPSWKCEHLPPLIGICLLDESSEFF